jgi:hypothetical protein
MSDALDSSREFAPNACFLQISVPARPIRGPTNSCNAAGRGPTFDLRDSSHVARIRAYGVSVRLGLPLYVFDSPAERSGWFDLLGRTPYGIADRTDCRHGGLAGRSGVAGHGADRPGPSGRHGHRRTGRSAAGRDRHGYLAVVDRSAHHGVAGRRQLHVPGDALGRLQTQLRTGRLQARRARQPRRRPRPDHLVRRPARGRRPQRENHRDRRLAAGRHLDHEDRHQPQGRRVDRRAQLDRRLGRAVRGPGRADAGLRRGRQPQEPAVGLRELRHPEPGPRRHRRHRPHRGGRRHRVLRGLLRQRRSLGQLARFGRRDELGRRGDRDHDQERRQHVQGPLSLELRTRQLGRLQRESGGDAGPRLFLPERRQRQPVVREPQPVVLGRARRPRRPDHARQGVVLRRLQPLQDRQAGLGPARGVLGPRHLRQLHRQGHLQAVHQRHLHRLLPAGPQAEAAPRHLGAAPVRIGPRPGQHVAHVQGRVAEGAERPHVPQCQRRELQPRLADGRQG